MKETYSDLRNQNRSGAPLAIEGGPKNISHPFKLYNSIGKEETEAAKQVLETGVLSQFLGAWHPDFYGGPKVKELEKVSAEYFGVKHAVTVNSWTSGLIAAVGAIDIEPGDEVIVSPWTMCASATAILNWNAIPIFADIDPKTFCIDPKSVEKNISPKTKAILAIDIFGQSCDLQSLQAIAKKHRLKLISDTAQAPGARYRGQYAGTMADIGGYSLNYHKHIHTGEGGILVTNDDTLAERLRLIRNHAEAVVGPKGETNLNNMIGYNFRLGEIECAIAIEQLKKLEGIIANRQRIADRLTHGLSGLRGLSLPVIPEGSTHVYYIYPMVLDIAALGKSRAQICEALAAEGLDGLISGYQNIHLLPMYQQKIAYGSSGFPWNASFTRKEINYSKGICPVAEKLHESTFLGFSMCKFEMTDDETDLVISTFRKVWEKLF